MNTVTESATIHQEITSNPNFNLLLSISFDYFQCGDFPVLNVPESQISGLYHTIEG
jgi:hypothetical protein